MCIFTLNSFSLPSFLSFRLPQSIIVVLTTRHGLLLDVCMLSPFYFIISYLSQTRLSSKTPFPLWRYSPPAGSSIRLARNGDWPISSSSYLNIILSSELPLISGHGCTVLNGSNQWSAQRCAFLANYPGHKISFRRRPQLTSTVLTLNFASTTMSTFSNPFHDDVCNATSSIYI